MPPPQSPIFMREHIMGLVLVKFIVERHFVQETVHLPTPSEKPSHSFTHRPYKGRYICSLGRLSEPPTNLPDYDSPPLTYRTLPLLQRWLSACLSLLSPCPMLGINPGPCRHWGGTNYMAHPQSVTHFLSLLLPPKQVPGKFMLSLTVPTIGP